ncbi:MAG: MraY family glycosyltransferase [Shinella sp.]|nr:MraY family glycosyltransferase [Shinella sp.]
MLVVLLKWVAAPLSLIDIPDQRKRHDGSVPLCGGIAIFFTFALFSLVSGAGFEFGLSFWVALFVVLGVGIVDDRMELPAMTRFAAQVLVAILIVGAAELPRISLGSLLPVDLEMPGLMGGLLLVSVLFSVGLMNAWNMIDGVDGLAGGAAAVALIWILSVALLTGAGSLVVPIAILLPAICGFLIFNMRSPWRGRASVFLGDAGSTTLGAVIAYLIVNLSAGAAQIPFLTLLWIVVFPVVETLSLIVRRIHAGRNPMTGDRRHMHHLLMDHGFSAAATTNLIVLASAVLGGIGFLGIYWDIPDEAMAAGLALPVAAHITAVWMLGDAGPLRWHQMRARILGELPHEAVGIMVTEFTKPLSSPDSVADTGRLPGSLP